MEQANREQFLLDRKTGIGGSDIAAIMGLSQFKTALDVYNEKIASPFTEDNDTLRRGRRVEKYVLEEYSERSREILEIELPMFRSSEYPFLIGNIDAKIANQNVIIEAKSSRFNIASWQGKIPDYYLVQIAHYANICDADRVDLAVLFNNWEYGCFSYYRDESLENKIKYAAIEFWQNNVLKQNPPAFQNIQDVIKAYPCNVDDKEVIADDGIVLEIMELTAIGSKIKELHQKEEMLKLKVMEYMKDAEKLNINDNFLVSWRKTVQNRLDIQVLKTEHPEIYNAYLKKIETRPLKFIVRNNHE